MVETNKVLANTETTNNVSNSDKVSELWVEHNTITEDVTLAEELEGIAKIVETVAISGLKCHECKFAKEVVDHKEKVIKDQDLKLVALQTRIRKTDKKVQDLGKERKKLVTENNKSKKYVATARAILAGFSPMQWNPAGYQY